MDIIKVNAIDSTNSLAREMFKENPRLPPTCISAEHQLKGRGQRGTHWNAQPGQNLTFSILYPKPQVSISHHFLLSASVATTIVEVLERMSIPKLKLKWPNDIMSANYKVGGILIENIISEAKLSATVIGVGLNVNQTEFEDLPAASSLKLVSGNHFVLEELLEAITNSIDEKLSIISDDQASTVLDRYKRRLFRKGQVSTFQLQDKTFLTGMIEDVSLSGKLIVRTEPEVQKEFDLKEIRLCF